MVSSIDQINLNGEYLDSRHALLRTACLIGHIAVINHILRIRPHLDFATHNFPHFPLIGSLVMDSVKTPLVEPPQYFGSLLPVAPAYTGRYDVTKKYGFLTRRILLFLKAGYFQSNKSSFYSPSRSCSPHQRPSSARKLAKMDPPGRQTIFLSQLWSQSCDGFLPVQSHSGG